MKFNGGLVQVFFILSCLKVSEEYSYQFKKSSRSNDTQFLSSVFLDAIGEIFLRFHLEFDLVVYGKVSPHIFEVLKGIQKSENPTRIVRKSVGEGTKDVLSRPAIVLCESLEKIQEFINHHDLVLEPNDFPQRFRFLFYAEKPFEVEKIGANQLDSGTGHVSWFAYFIVNQEGKKWVPKKLPKDILSNF